MLLRLVSGAAGVYAGVRGAREEADEMNSVIFPWPARELSPNSRGHWSKRAKASRAYRKACWALTLESGIKVTWNGPVHLFLAFHAPDNRQRDDDNVIASFKSGRDGLADALGINDKRFVTHPFMGEPYPPGGAVHIRISPTS